LFSIKISTVMIIIKAGAEEIFNFQINGGIFFIEYKTVNLQVRDETQG
jgi:hypothetical protein